MLAELNLAPSQPAGEDRADTLSPDPVTTPAAPGPVPGIAPATPQPSRRHRIAMTGALVVLMAGLVIALVSLSHFGRKQAPAPAAPGVASSPGPAPPPTAPGPGPAPPPTAPAPEPAPMPPFTPAAASVAPDPSFDSWVQDFDAARRQAEAQGKDVLLRSTRRTGPTSPSAGPRGLRPCRGPGARSPPRFVPVHIDFPEYPLATRRVQDARRNERSERGSSSTRLTRGWS